MRRITVLALAVCVFLLGTSPTFAAPWNDDTTDDTCYQILIPETRIPAFAKYTPLSLADFYQTEVYGPVADIAKSKVTKVAREQANLIVSKNSRDMAFGINFNGNQIAVLDYKMGEVFGQNHDLLLKDAFPYFAAARSLPDDEVYDNYRVMMYYFADSLDFMYCSALLQPIVKSGVEPKDITAERLGMMLPPKPFEIKTLEKNGTKFKMMDVVTTMLDKTDGQPLIESHWIAVMPESTSKRYNPYALVETYKKTVDYFNTSGNFDPKNPNAIRAFDPLKNYALAQEMLKQGQEFAWKQSWLVGDETQMVNVLHKKSPNDLQFLQVSKVPLATQTAYFADVASRLGEGETTVFKPLDKIRQKHGITAELTDEYVADAKAYLADPDAYVWSDATSHRRTYIVVAASIFVVGLLAVLIFHRKIKK